MTPLCAVSYVILADYAPYSTLAVVANGNVTQVTRYLDCGPRHALRSSCNHFLFFSSNTVLDTACTPELCVITLHQLVTFVFTSRDEIC
jgi:hypothetical protein